MSGGAGSFKKKRRNMRCSRDWSSDVCSSDLYGVENWRGRRAWNQYRQKLEASGEKLDLRAFIPKPIPDEQNFAATPVVKSWFEQSSVADRTQRWEDDYAKASRHLSRSKDR